VQWLVKDECRGSKQSKTGAVWQRVAVGGRRFVALWSGMEWSGVCSVQGVYCAGRDGVAWMQAPGGDNGGEIEGRDEVGEVAGGWATVVS